MASYGYLLDLTKEQVEETLKKDIWGIDTNEFIGYYCKEGDNKYCIKDIRKLNFARIPPFPGDVDSNHLIINLPEPILHQEINNYYQFKWKLEDNSVSLFKIYLDNSFEPKSILPKYFIEKLYHDIINDKSRNFEAITNVLDTLKKQLSANDSTFIYELLQNANDYPFQNQKVAVEFHLQDNHLLFLHTGDNFNVRNVSAICGINEKEKVENKQAIGYKGIGFKTVFLNNKFVYINSGEYSFRFDESSIKRMNAPWQILPIWTDHQFIDEEVSKVFDVKNNFRVQIALKPTDPLILGEGDGNYVDLFSKLFKDPNIILFIPNIESVDVYFKGDLIRSCKKSTNDWIVNDYYEEINLDLQELINKNINTSESRIPEKYKDFTKTKVSFACHLNGTTIKPIENGLVYCYLPTNKTFGFPFLLNTDMIPTGNRADLESEVKLNNELNFNSELSFIAGTKFFYWIKDLLISYKYDKWSVFSLVPNFENCKRENLNYYDRFISKFRNGFEQLLKYEKLIPIEGDFELITNIISDDTGVTSNEIIPDDLFYLFYPNKHQKLPLNELRGKRHFKSFINQYISTNQKFGWDTLLEVIKTAAFQDWLKIPINNHKLINYLCDKKELKRFIKEKIFLSNKYELTIASELYYNIDTELKYLRCFEDYLPCLSYETRFEFEDNMDWVENVPNVFKKFHAASFVNEELLCNDYFNLTIEKLNENKVNSIGFFHFLAKNKLFDKKYKQLPFLNTHGEIINHFNSIVYFDSIRGQEVQLMSWMDTPWINFVSTDYFSYDVDEIRTLFILLGVKDYTDHDIIERIVLIDEFKFQINCKIVEWDSNIQFVKFLDRTVSLNDKGLFRDYVLRFCDKEGNKQFLNEGVRSFQSTMYNEYAQKEWVESDWMYSLDDHYFTNLSNQEHSNLKIFFKDYFGIYEMSSELFYSEIVRPNRNKIYENLRNESTNLDFVEYLLKNYKLIFEIKKDDFGDMPILNDLGEIVNPTEFDYKYLYELNILINELMERNWFPKNFVLITSEKYNRLGLFEDYLKIFKKIGYNQNQNLNSIFTDVIVKELDTISELISAQDINVDFHNYVCANIDSLLPEHIVKLQRLPVYLYQGKNLSARMAGNSNGHYILSDKQVRVLEIIEMGIISPNQIQIIDNSYSEKNQKYWCDGLGNEYLTHNSFSQFITSSQIRKIVGANLSKDINTNILFWRWVKNNVLSDTFIKKFVCLPLITTTIEGGQNFTILSDNSIYISQEYLFPGKSIIDIVSKYDQNIFIVTEAYLEDRSAQTILAWKLFFEKLGVITKIKELIFDKIIPSLSELEDISLPQLLSDFNYVEEIYENWEMYISDLLQLKLKTISGSFQPIKFCIFVDLNYDEEPFKYLSISNEIDRIYFRDKHTKRLILKIAEFAGSKIIDKLCDLKVAKVERYLELQNLHQVEINLHFIFIKELATLEDDEIKLCKSINNTFLLSRDNKYFNPFELTLGSLYMPLCDFESNGISEADLNYISNRYHENNSSNSQIKKLFYRVLKVHSKFNETDIPLLINRKFSIYFWGIYTQSSKYNLDESKKWIENGKFSNTKCIPTKDSVKYPKELYHLSIKYFVAKRIPDWENNLPSDEIQENVLLNSLNFKTSLDFEDGLQALLNIKDAEKRQKILGWMLNDSENRIQNVSLVALFRDSDEFLWRNGKQEPVPIKNLYALPPSSYLNQYFNQDEHIISNSYFPSDKNVFIAICDMLQIPIIEEEDMIFSPVDNVLRNENLKDFFKSRLLNIAGIEQGTNFLSTYKEYVSKLNKIDFWECSSITLTYQLNPVISQTSKKFWNDGNDYHFVKSWDNKHVFADFILSLYDHLRCQLDKDIFRIVFDPDEDLSDLLKKYCKDALFNEEFKSLILDFDPNFDSPINYPFFLDDNDDYNPNPTPVEIPIPIDDSKGEETSHNDEDDTPIKVEPTSLVIKSHISSSTTITNPYRTPPPASDDFSERGNDHFSKGINGKTPSNTPAGNFIPKYNKSDITEWKKKAEQAKLGVADATDDELQATKALIEGGKTNDEIIDEHYLAKYRLYNALLHNGYKPSQNQKDFVNDDTSEINTNKGYIYTRSAKGGILFISSFLWNTILKQTGRLCMYYGNKACDFEFITTITQLKDYVGDDNIIIQIKGENKIETINSVFSGKVNDSSAHVLIRIKSNERYNSLFNSIHNNDSNNNAEF